MKYICELCGFVYDEDEGYPVRRIAPGTAFARLPEDFACPSCGSEREAFSEAVPRAADQSGKRDYEFWNDAKYSDQQNKSDR